jgi:hypothetical protein
MVVGERHAVDAEEPERLYRHRWRPEEERLPDYRFFTESWEAILPRVIESLAVTSTVCANGTGAIDVTSAAYCVAS